MCVHMHMHLHLHMTSTSHSPIVKTIFLHIYTLTRTCSVQSVSYILSRMSHVYIRSTLSKLALFSSYCCCLCQPVAVCPSARAAENSTSEVASASYEARACGIKARMRIFFEVLCAKFSKFVSVCVFVCGSVFVCAACLFTYVSVCVLFVNI